MFHLDQFISQYVTKRPVSMFSADIEANRDALSKKIAGKSVLVIGGARFHRLQLHQGVAAL